MGFEYLGQNIRFYRRLRGFAQHELAARAGLAFTQPYVSKLECGWRPFDVSHVDALAAALSLSRQQLLRQPRIVQSDRPVIVTTAKRLARERRKEHDEGQP